MSKWEKQRQDNRRKYPDLAAFVDDLRAHFGEAALISLEAKDER